MQKWEESQRRRVHESIIENAKSSFKRYSNSREKILQTSRTKNIPNKKLPFHRILEIFQLEKYSSLLISYGFPEKLAQKKSLDYIDEMVEKVDEKDKERFFSLLNTLIIMSKDLKKVEKTPVTNKSKKSIYPPPPSTSTNSKPTPYSVQKS